MSARSFLLAILLLGGAAFAANPVAYDAEHLQYWMRTLKGHSLESVRKSAAKMLGAMADRRALPGLIEGLKDPSSAVRKETAISLGAMVDPRAVPALESVYERDPDPEVRKHAQAAIQQIEKRKEFDKEKAKKNDGSV